MAHVIRAEAMIMVRGSNHLVTFVTGDSRPFLVTSPQDAGEQAPHIRDASA